MKKGMSMSFVVILIILLLSAIVIFFGIGKISAWIKSSSDMEACRTSVELRSHFKVLGKSLVASPVDCVSQWVNIKDKGDWEDNAKEELAISMHDCWYQFGEGKMDFLSDYDFFGDSTYCYICSTINFEDSLEDETIIGFDQYLIENGYANYLWTDNYDENKIAQAYQTIYTERPLYVIFVADKSREFWNNLISAEAGGIFVGGCYTGVKVGAIGGPKGAGIGCVAGGIISSAGYAFARDTGYGAYIYLVNGDQVNNICKKI